MTLNILRFLFILAFGFFSFQSIAGSDSTGDSAAATRPSLFFSIDYRSGFITTTDSTGAHIIGYRFGAEVNKKFRFAIGYHYLSNQIVRHIEAVNFVTNVKTLTVADVRLRYGSVSAEYVLFNSDLWQITTPLIVGLGESAFIPPANYYEITGRYFTLFIEPSLTVQYNLIPFIGIGTGVGYRIMPVGDSSLRSTFATPVYDIRIKILLDDVAEVLFPNGLWKKKSTGEKNPEP